MEIDINLIYGFLASQMLLIFLLTSLLLKAEKKEDKLKEENKNLRNISFKLLEDNKQKIHYQKVLRS